MHPKLQAALWLVRQLDSSQFAEFGDEETSALASALELADLPQGHLLYKAGALPHGIWVVRTGSVELTAGTGGRRAVVQLLRRGDIVGDVYLVIGMPAPVTARVGEPGRFVHVSADNFRTLLEKHPRLASVWMANLCSRLAQSRVRLLELLAPALHQRLARLLLEETEDGVLRMSQAGIAQMLGAQRSSVNRALKKLERDGVVELRYASVILNDKERLAALAAEVAPVGAKVLADQPNTGFQTSRRRASPDSRASQRRASA